MAPPDSWLDRPSWAPAWLPDRRDAVAAKVLRWVIFALLAVGLGSCMLRGADQPADPVVLDDGSLPTVEEGAGDPSTGSAVSEGAVSGDVTTLAATLGTVTVDLVDAAGESMVLCVLHADDAAERAQGLMEVTDLTGVDGMLFSRPDPTEGAFYMYRTLVPLTVGWWSADGTYVGQTDMVPCDAAEPGDCPTYPPPSPYVFGLEVIVGDPLAARFPGSRLVVGTSPCAPG